MRAIKLVLVATALLTAQAFATPISGTSGNAAPPLTGATHVMDFDAFADQDFSAIISADGTIEVSGVGGGLRIDDYRSGMFNARGTHYVDNNSGDTSALRFDFADPVSAFAFNWGASDVQWTLSAFDAADNLIESLAIDPTLNSNNGEYFGLADAHIKYATLSAGVNDWVFLDNLTVVQEPATTLPEPASLALFGVAAGAAAIARRRKGKIRA